ncbi:putative Gamma-soluble NSF attachment protein [Hypsibius exemplaris]|uniref:Gamma-soluble NSF attachment protein n=1 Tax=Hypsibius exemplaris TaxID=2072580 RepID=A0A1W0WMZ8_HYPEX|nr:putative Gamma-soluble NSF attachment protein [Hypsibius exemplaris]
MAANKFAAEGEKELKEADKHVKTGILKWSPDYDLAAMSYTKAATSFKNAKDHAKNLECSVKAGECHLKLKGIFQAAKSFEQGAMAAKELGDFKKLAELVNRAYLLYIENGTSDTAGNLLDRGGRMLEEQLPEQAVAMYKKAADLAQIQDKAGNASEMFDRAGRLLVKMEKYNDAAKVLEELLQHELSSPTAAARRYVLLLVLIHLKRDDYVAARKAYEEGTQLPDFIGSGELGIARTLLDAFDTYDAEAFKTAATGPFIRQLDPAYARLARSLKVPDGDDIPSVTPKTQPLPPPKPAAASVPAAVAPISPTASSPSSSPPAKSTTPFSVAEPQPPAMHERTTRDAVPLTSPGQAEGSVAHQEVSPEPANNDDDDDLT